MKKISVRQLTTMALMAALLVVFSQFFAIETPLLKVSFAFIPHVLTGLLFSPVWSGIIAVIADIISHTLFSKGSPFFLGFTLNAFLTGSIYSLFFYKKSITWKNTIFANIAVLLIVRLGLTPIWLMYMYHIPYFNMAMWLPRLIKNAVITPIEIFCIYSLGKLVPYTHWQKTIEETRAKKKTKEK